MNIEPDIFDYLQTTSLEPHDDYTSEITYKDQKIIWNRLREQDKEIERLNNIINELIEQKTDYGYVNILEMRLEQANNIINELEKHVEDSLKLADENETEDTVSYVRDILNKLQELKGDGSNE